jgi:hypothetical protein
VVVEIEKEAEAPPELFRTVGMVCEADAADHRVAVTPTTVRKLQQLGYRCVLQSGVGGEQPAGAYTDAAYVSAGARLNNPWVKLRARWVTRRACWVTLRARWVTLRARWVKLRARWVTRGARWVTLRARWVTR